MTDTASYGHSFWDYLAQTDKPIFIYGTGNGADKIFDVLDRRGIAVKGIFASDGFVRERFFRGFRVLPHSDVTAEYGDDIIVLLAFGTTLPDVTEFIEKLDREHELFIPEVPLYGGELFDCAHCAALGDRIEKTRELFSDERSLRLYDDAIDFRLSGKYEFLKNTYPVDETLNELFSDRNINTVLDGGAFKGDSAAVFASSLHPRDIYAVEADEKTFVKLCAYAGNEMLSTVHPIHGALWNECGETEYVSSGSRGSARSGQNHRAKVISVPTLTIDSIAEEVSFDFIKLDVEGAEFNALCGARETILRDSPNLAVSLYHRTDDLFELTEFVHSLLPDHRLYLRRVPCIPMWDLTLYAVRK